MHVNPKAIVVLIVTCFLSFHAAHAQLLKPETYYWPSQPEKIELEKKFADASAVVLKDVRILNFFYDKENGKKSELQLVAITHKVIQINDTRAIESNNRIYVPLSGVIDVSDLRSRTISPDGKITELNKDNIKEIANKDGKGSYKIFAVEGLEKGSRLEYFYKLKKVVDFSTRINVQSTEPVQLQQVVIVSPDNLKFDTKTYNGKSETIDSVIDDRRFITITSRDVPGKEEEKYSAYAAELMRHEIQLAYNTAVGKARILSYNSAVQRMYPVLFEQDPKATKKVQKLSDQLGINKLSGEEKIRHIENYIKTTIQEEKNAGPEYSDLGKIIQDKMASTTGILKLYISMLTANGIKTQVVYTTDRSKVNFDPDFESWNYLDENILYFPDYDKYLDPSDITLRYPMIPTAYGLNNGLFMEEVAIGTFKSATGSVKKIPAADVSKNENNLDIYCKFNKTLDSTDLKITQTFSGILASGNRFAYNYIQKDDKKKMLDELMKQGLQDAKVVSEEIKNTGLLDNDKPLEISGEVAGTALIEKTGKDILFKIGDVIGPQSELYQEKERQSQVDMFYAHRYHRLIKVEVPDGYKLEGLDALKMNIKFDFEGRPACGFTSEYELKGNILTVDCHEYYNTIQLPKEQFENFRKVINAAADFNKINIVLEKS